MNMDLDARYRRWLAEVWGKGNIEVARELVAEDLIDHNAVAGQPPGIDGQLWALSAIRRAFPDLAFTADVVVASGDFVAGRWTMTGQEIFRAEGGKLVEVWHSEDAPGMLRQLGLEPPPAILRFAARRSARRYRRERAGAHV
jgi:hypothetical protein